MRRIHRKTRNGCASCKRRRVKCDEGKPSCLNCQRNELVCSLKFLTPVVPEPLIKVKFQPAPAAGLHHLSLDLSSVELLHHYTGATYLTLGTERNVVIWRDMIPQLAASNEFLMNSMLAISALHLAYLQPQRRQGLLQRASVSQNRALAQHRRDISSQESSTGVHAALAFGGFAVPYILAQSRELGASAGRVPRLDDNSPHWFHVIRGLVHMTIKRWPELSSGPFGPLLTKNQYPVNPKDNPEDIQLLRIKGILLHNDDTPIIDQYALNICSNTLEELRRVAAVPYSASRKLGILAIINIWPGTISREFIVLLHERRPEALVILAHYCVLLKRGNSYWYLEGVGEKMLVEIADTLGERWLPWIQWAIDQPVS